MIVKNEMKNLSRCLNSVKDIVNEIIIVDTGSIDLTKEIASKYQAKIYDFTWNNNFAAARNFALKHSTGDWNLVLDADEYIVDCNIGEIRKFMELNKAIGRIKIVSNFLENGEEKQSFAFISRLFPKEVYYSGRIHEQINSKLPHYRLPFTIYHDGYLNSNEEKAQRNISILFEEYSDDPENPYILYQLAKEHKRKNDIQGALNYLEKANRRINKEQGFYPVFIVDYIYVLMESGHLNEGMRVIQDNEEYLNDYPDFHFASGLFYMEYLIKGGLTEVSQIFSIERAFKKCIEIGEVDKYDCVIGTGTFLAYYNLGVFYEVVGNRSEAIKYYQKSAQLDYFPAMRQLKRM